MTVESLNWRQWVLPAGLVACVVLMIVPLPSAVIDVLLVANIALAVIILLTTLQVQSPIEFSLFPSVLLAATLGRMALNISTTRLILTEGHRGSDAAGGVIQSFGSFVVGDQLFVGLVIFAIIAVVQFVVVTKGATRISEVAARFSLDAMPGRQMAIDADLNAGVIDQTVAAELREGLHDQADFYGAMDGASKFVRGDAIAGVLITLINIVGGIAMGLYYGLSIPESAQTFTRLTIGDGLASQIPAFLVAIAAGMLITRNHRKTNLPQLILKQLFGRTTVLLMAAVFLVLLTLTKLPSLPLLTIATVCVTLYWMQTRQRQIRESETADRDKNPDVEPAEDTETQLEELLKVDPLEIEMGVELISLADPQRGGVLLTKIGELRQQIAARIGIVLPKVRIRDNLQLPATEYRIRIHSQIVAGGSLMVENLLAIPGVDGVQARMDGVPVDPFDADRGSWISPSQRDFAKKHGYRCLTASEALISALETAVVGNADQILSRDGTRFLVEQVRKSSPAVVEELIPDLLKLSDVQQILQMLLREHVSIRRLSVILEALGDFAGRSNDLVWLAEFVRQRLAPNICQAHLSSDGKLWVAQLPAQVESKIASGLSHENGTLQCNLSPAEMQELVQQIEVAVQPLVAQGHRPIVLVGQKIRPSVKQISYATLPHLVVLSPNDLTPDVPLQTIPVKAAA